MKIDHGEIFSRLLPKIGILSFCFFFLYSTDACSVTKDLIMIDWFGISIGLLGGLSFFLYGMQKMSDGMKAAAGNQMRVILKSLTKNRFIAVIVGAFVTMIIQSSSATTVMLVSFVQAGLLNMTQSMGVILGADIGTTITAQMIAFKLTDYALVFVAAGFSLLLFGKSENTKSTGEILLGFGLLFFGMKLMSDVMAPLRTYPGFITLMHDLESPAMGILVGAGFTALVQSSSATTGILIVLAQQGLITVEGGIPVILGANIGTCVTAGLAGIGATREAKRVAIAHVLFKVVGVALFIFWIPKFAQFVEFLAMKSESGTARMIANAHTIFNVTMAIIMLPFIPLLSRLIYVIFPEQKKSKSLEIATHHIDGSMLKTPPVAMDLSRAEIARMARLLGRMLNAVIIPFISDERYLLKQKEDRKTQQLLLREIPKRDAVFPELTLMEGIHFREEKINFLDRKIGEYLTAIARQNITEDQAAEIFCMASIVKDLESIGDIIERSMIPLVAKKRKLYHDFSDEGKEELLIYHSKASKQLRHLEAAFSETDLAIAQKIMEKEKKYLDLEQSFRARHLKRMIANHEASVKTTEVYMELIDLIKQVVLYSSNIAKTYINATTERKSSSSESGQSGVNTFIP
tara:strand:- start:2848 stop:4743 length:1896 start_codon:yes stop_codon:yes gene_type:complete